jgi:hypothetical protein
MASMRAGCFTAALVSGLLACAHAFTPLPSASRSSRPAGKGKAMPFSLKRSPCRFTLASNLTLMIRSIGVTVTRAVALEKPAEAAAAPQKEDFDLLYRSKQ